MTRLLQKVGNSKGVILNRTMLDHLGVGNEIEVTLEEGRIILSAPSKPSSRRQSFEDAKNSTFAQYEDALERLANA